MNTQRLLEGKSLSELREIASTLELEGYSRMRKADLVQLILESAESAEGGDAASAQDEEDDEDTRGGARSRERRRERARNGDGGGDSDDSAAAGGAEATDDDRSGGDGGRDGRDRDGKDRGGRNGRDGRDRNGKDGGDRGGKGGGNDRDRQPQYEGGEVREGVLDLLPEGYGFLRTSGYLTGKRDVYVSQSYVRRFGLRRGDRVRGPIRANNKGSDKFPAIAEILEVEGVPLEEHQQLERPEFDDLTPVGVAEPLQLGADGPLATRLVDVVAPLALGHRALVIGPRRSGRSTLLRQIAAAVGRQSDDVELIMLLVDARPEEVGRARDEVTGTEVAAATFDRGPEDLVAVAELAVERGRRLVERGRDVVIVLDDMTSLGRAYEQAAQGGRGGTSDGWHGPAKRFFASARRVEEGGSLTIVAAATTDTGMTPDEHQAEILLGAATVELRLDAALARRRVQPALDLVASGSHHEDELLGDRELSATVSMRRALADAGADATAAVIDGLDPDATHEDVLKAFESLD